MMMLGGARSETRRGQFIVGVVQRLQRKEKCIGVVTQGRPLGRPTLSDGM
jgi:hypothetical protein